MANLDPITVFGLILSAGGTGFAIYAIWLKHRLDRMQRDHDQAHRTPGE